MLAAHITALVNSVWQNDKPGMVICFPPKLCMRNYKYKQNPEKAKEIVKRLFK